MDADEDCHSFNFHAPNKNLLNKMKTKKDTAQIPRNKIRKPMQHRIQYFKNGHLRSGFTTEIVEKSSSIPLYILFIYESIANEQFCRIHFVFYVYFNYLR